MTKRSLTFYTRCSGHALPLVITHSCSLPSVRNTLDKLKTIFLFLQFNPKRIALLADICSRNISHPTRRKPLINLFETRWAARHDAYSHFNQAFVFIVDAFKIMIGASSTVDYDEDFVTKWDVKTKGDAASLLASITSFDFIVSFLIVHQMLSHLSGITVQLQKCTINILEAYSNITAVSMPLILCSK